MMVRKIAFLVPGAQIYVPKAFLDLRERARFLPSCQATGSARRRSNCYLPTFSINHSKITILPSSPTSWAGTN